MTPIRRRLAGLRALLALLMAVGLSQSLLAQQATPERVVTIYNWSDYIDPKVLDDFTAETGIKVVYDTYDNNEIVETKLLAGLSGYDIVVPSGPFLARQIKAGLHQPLDKARLDNARHIWPDIAARLAVHDPGNRHAINYMWGTTGIGINVAKVRERLGRDLPLNSWDLVLKPEIAAKLADCGIHVLDAPEDLFPILLNYLRLDPDSKLEADLRRAADVLARIRPHIRRFHSSEYINALANGDICLAIGYSGDVLQAARRALDASNGIEITYIVPTEGTLMWFDSFAIPLDATHVDEAYTFINYMLRPEVAARNSNVVSYASGNLAARDLVKPEIRNNPGIYPDDQTFRRLFTNTAFDDRAQKVVTRLWTRIKSGR